jgi:stage II sporulation protein AA (anti-sigma F factor antagonist)
MSVSDDSKVMIVGADGEAVAYLVGEFDLAVRDLLVDAMTQASATKPRLVIDLSRTTFIDSTGLKALVDVWRRRRDAGLELVLREPSRAVMYTLQLAGLDELLPIDTTSRPTVRTRTAPDAPPAGRAPPGRRSRRC